MADEPVKKEAICEHCGLNDRYNPGEKKCHKCGKPIKSLNSSKYFGKISSFSKTRVVKFLFYFVVMAILPIFAFRPYIDMWTELVGPWAMKAMPGWAGLSILLPIGIILVFGGLLSLFLSKQGYFIGGFVLVIYFVGLVLIPAVVPLLPGPGGQLGNYLDVFWCSITHISDPMTCQNIITQTPEGKKADEGYDVLDVKLGIWRNDRQAYELSTIYKGSIYSLPINIENKIPNKVVKVYVEGYIEDENCNDKLYCKEANYIKLLPGECSKDNPCDINKKKSVTMTSDKEIGEVNISDTDTEGKAKTYKIGYNSYAKLRVVVTYSYSTDGKSDFVIFKSDNDVTDIPVKEKGAGPLDLIVFFSPDYYVAGRPLGKENKMYTFISMKNMRDGKAVLKQIKLSRLPAFSDISSGVCKTNFDKNIFNENEAYELGANQLPRDEEYMFTCEHTLSVKEIKDPSKNVKFIANLDFDYRQTFTQSIRVTPIIGNV